MAFEAGGDGLAAQRDNLGAVGRRQHTGHHRGGDLALRVTDHQCGLDTAGPPDLGERDHHGPQHRLHDLDAVQPPSTGTAEQHVLQRPVGEGRESGGAVLDRGAEHRRLVPQPGAHLGPLRALPGEDERDLADGLGRPFDHVGGDAAGGERRQPPAQFGQVRAEHDGPVLQFGPAEGQREPDARRVRCGLGVHVGGQAARLPAQPRRTPGRQRPRQHGGGDRRHRRPGGLLGRRLLLGGRGLLDDHVRVGAAEAEGGDGCPARLPGLGPLPRLGQQLHRARRPVHVRGRLGDVQGLRQHAVAHRHDHLDDAADARRGLRVADVGLERPEPERPAVRPLLAVRGEQRLRLDRVAQRGAGAVRLDGVHLGRRQTGRRQRLADHPLLGRPVGGGQAVTGPVLVDRRAAHDGQHRVPVAAGVGEPLDQQHADALAPAGAVRVVGERLAATVGGQAALAAELHERAGRGHHGHAPGQRERALAAAQRLHGQVQGDQRGRARGVHGHRRALQAQRVGDAAGGDAAEAAGAQVALDALRDRAEPAGVLVVHEAGEDAGPAALEPGRVDPRPLERLPGRLQQQALLRVHRQRLTRRDPEERRVELAGVVQEAALADVAGALLVGVVVDQRLDGPAAVGREAADGVAPVRHQLPQFLRGGHTTGVAAAHADDRDRLPVALLQFPHAPTSVAQISGGALEVVAQLVLVHHLVRSSRHQSRACVMWGREPGVRRSRARRRAGRTARRRWPTRCRCRPRPVARRRRRGPATAPAGPGGAG